MYEIVKSSFNDFRASYKQYLSFSLLYMFLMSVLFVPMITFTFHRMLRMISTGSLLNADVYKMGLSTTGLIGMLIISLLAVVILFVEFGVMIMIAQQRYFRQRVFVVDALVTTIKKFPKLLRFSFFQLLLVVLIFIPFTELTTFPALLDFNVPIFLTNQWYSSSFYTILIYILFLLVAIFFFIRSLFTLHFIFIEDKSIWEATKCSWKLTKVNKLTIIFSLFFFHLMIFMSFFLFVTLLSYIPTVLDTMIVGNLIKNYLITFSSYMTMIVSLFLIPINLIVITRLFYRFKKNQGECLSDRLNVQTNRSLVHFERQITGYFAKRKYTLLTVVVVFITTIFFINNTVSENIVYLKWNVEVAAHRGDSKNSPENSLSSIRSALEKGVDAVEVDVMLTKDGVVILNHDSTLERVAGISSKVNEMTYKEISQVDIGHLFNEEFVGEQIPTLGEVLAQLKEENVKIIIDLKPADSSGALAVNVADLIEKYEMEQSAYVQAFDYPSLQVIRQKNSEIKIGQILYLSAGSLADIDVDFYTIRQTMLSERFIKNAKKQNREVWVWTVNIERNMREVLKFNIDGIITSYPEKVQRLIGIDFVDELKNK